MPDALILEPRRMLAAAQHHDEAAGLRVTEWPHQQLASVMARRDDLARHGIDAPDRPAWRHGWIATGPDRWLVARREQSPALAAELEATLGDVAAVVDLSDAYACFTLGGPALREVLAKGITFDLDPSAFGPGSAAVTAIAYIGVILWCEDSPDTFELAVTRSYAGSFLHWLEASAAARGTKPSG